MGMASGAACKVPFYGEYPAVDGHLKKKNALKWGISGQIITTSLSSLTGIMVRKGNHPQMALFQVSEIL